MTISAEIKNLPLCAVRVCLTESIPHLASNKVSGMLVSASRYDGVPFNIKSSSEEQASNFASQQTASTPFVLSPLINNFSNVKVAQRAVWLIKTLYGTAAKLHAHIGLLIL